MNNLEHHFLCASSPYWRRCFQHDRNFCRSSHLPGISIRPVRTLLICPAWETLAAVPA